MAVLLGVFGAMISLSESFASAGNDDVVPKFAIKRFMLEGNTILESIQVERLLKPYTGLQREFGDVQQAMEQLEKAYHDQGYAMVTVSLPEQEMKDGNVLLKVIESRIKNITVEGNLNFSTDNIEAGFPMLRKGTRPMVRKISENLRVVNENPAKKVTLQLQSGDKEDEINAVLKISDDKPWKVGFSLDNSGNSFTGDYRIGFLGQYFNLFNLDHVATVQYSTSPDRTDKVNSYSASYRIPIYRLGDSVDIFGGYSDMDTTISGADFNLRSNGKGISTGIRYNFNLRRFGGYEHKFVAGMDYRRIEQNTDLLSNQGNSSLLNSPPIAVHPFSLAYNGTLTFEGGEAGYYVGGVRNVPWGEKGEQADFDKQPHEPPPTADYTMLRFGASAGYALPGDWQMRLSLNGQYTDNTLVPAEQLGFGGSVGGRGYEEREVSGDQGYTGNAEIFSPDLARYIGITQTRLRLVGFYDDGFVFNSHPPRGEDDGSRRLAGTGTGVRLTWGKYLAFALDWGYALVSLPDNGFAKVTKEGDSKVHFKVMLTY